MEETRKEVKEPLSEPTIGKSGNSASDGKKEEGKGLLSSVKALFRKDNSEKKEKPEKPEKKEQSKQAKPDSGTKKALIAVVGLLTVMASYVAYNHFTSGPANRSTFRPTSHSTVSINRGAPVNRTAYKTAQASARSKRTVKEKTVKETAPSQTARTVSSSAPAVKQGGMKKEGTKKVEAVQLSAGKQRKGAEKEGKSWSSAESSAGRKAPVQTAEKSKPESGFFVNPEKTKFPNFKAFQEFYIKRLIELINEKRKELEEIQKEKQKVAAEIAQLQLQVQRIAVIPKQVERSSEKKQGKKKEKKAEPVLVPITVYGVVCHGTCRAYTDRGILTPGAVLPGGEKVEKITPHYIKTSLRTIEF